MNKNLPASFEKLCRSYLKMADRFQQLDVEYMTLRGKVVPLLKQLKAYQQTIETLKQESGDLSAELETITAKYEELKPFEELLSPDLQGLFQEAEEQIDLVDETLKEMERDDDPDLSAEDKALVEAFRHDPNAFVVSDPSSLSGTVQSGNTTNGAIGRSQVVSSQMS
ncbi:MAG: hypothetical protein WBA57_15735 [Elainellaceae cyanobacterium]